MGGAPEDWQKIVDQLDAILGVELANLNSPWTYYQLAIMLVCSLVARWASRRIEQRIEPRLRRIKGQPKLLRVLVIMLRRVDMVLLAVLLGLSGTIVQHSSWPSNAHILRIAAHLTAALAIVSVIAHLIRNRFLQSAFRIVGWTVAALSVFGWLNPTIAALEEISITIGQSRLSLFLILKTAILLVVLVWLANLVSDLLERRLRGELELSPTMQVLTGKLVRWGLLAIAILTALSALGVDLTAFTVFSGAIGIGLGFGLQKLASNLISGVIILTDRSIKPGDTVTIGDMRGTISSLHARYVSVLTLTGAELLVPNERFVTETVVNWSYSNRRMLVEIPFGISYDADPHEAGKIAIKVAEVTSRVLPIPAPNCQFRAFGDSSLDMVLTCWIDDPENGVGNVRSDVLFGLWAAFKKAGINIPFPHRELIIKPPQQVVSAVSQV